MRPDRLLSGRGCRLLSKMTGKGSMHVESCWWWYCSDPRCYPVRFRADILDRGRPWGQSWEISYPLRPPTSSLGTYRNSIQYLAPYCTECFSNFLLGFTESDFDKKLVCSEEQSRVAVRSLLVLAIRRYTYGSVVIEQSVLCRYDV